VSVKTSGRGQTNESLLKNLLIIREKEEKKGKNKKTRNLKRALE
jgi:hypothetical protein